MISLRAHNILDYVIGAALLVCPYVFGFADVMFARDVYAVLGLSLIGYSLLTDYEYSLSKVVPLSMHMTFDVVTGVFLVLAPSIYNYRLELSGFQYALHWILGLGAIAMVAFTRRGGEPPRAVLTPEAEFEEEQRISREAA
jgi:hypothetical protein